MKHIISKYLNHRANAEELKRLNEWADANPENRKMLRDLKNSFVLSALSDETSETRRPDAGVQAPTTPLRPHGRRKSWLKYAAVIAGIVIAENVIRIGFEEWNGPQMHYLSVNEGERATVVLADGTTVWLNSNSSISYPEKFSRRKREIELSGEAFFKVSKAKFHPFIVKTSEIDVRVVGTEFNVRAYPEDSQIDVQVVEGKVKVYPSDEDENALFLTANEMFTYDQQEKRMSRDSFDSESGNWRDGRYSFKNRKLREIASQLERIYAVDILITDQEVADQVYYGEINMNDPIEKILEVISLNKAFRYEIDNRNIIIKPF